MGRPFLLKFSHQYVCYLPLKYQSLLEWDESQDGKSPVLDKLSRAKAIEAGKAIIFS